MTKNPTPILLLVLVPVLGLAVALHAAPAFTTPLIVVWLVLLFMAGHQICSGRRKSS